MAAFGFTLVAAIADNAFLNRQLPTTWVCYQSNEELLQVLRSVVPATLVLPPGMSLPTGMPAKKPLIDPTEAEKQHAGSGALFGRVPGDKTPFTVRDYLDHAAMILGMTWKYDATRDAVSLDFPWHVSDPRSAAELIATLSTTTPPEDEKHIYCSTIDLKNDPWRPAFNALLSKPGNYPKAWQVRWKMEGVLPGLHQPINLFTGRILDETGTTHLLILNVQEGPVFSMASESTVGFYLFSETGETRTRRTFLCQRLPRPTAAGRSRSKSESPTHS